MKQNWIVAAVAAGAVWSGWRFTRWRHKRTTELKQKGITMETAVGPVEYAIAGSGPTLLVCHGGPGGYDQIETMAEFVAAGFQVLVPSRPGYLGTPLRAGQTMTQQAEALIALLDALGIEQVAAVGVSAGGPVALELAQHFPERLWGLVMLAGVALPYQPNEQAAASLLGRLFLTDGGLWLLDAGTWLFEQLSLRFPLASARLMIQTESELPNEQIDKHIDHMRRHRAQIEWYQALIRSTGPMSLRKAGLDNDLVQLAALPHLPLEQIALPTLVIHGQADADVPYLHAQFVAETVPKAKLISLPDTGHLIWLSPEWPTARQRLVDFLHRGALPKGN